MKPIKKAVIPAAGFGTRFLPQTKAIPKEMIPIIDKPIIQYIVEELVDSGIETIIIITGYHKRSIEDHFDHQFELEEKLKLARKFEELERIQKISEMAEFVYIRQKGRSGTGTTLLNIEHLVDNDPFVYVFGDELLETNPSRTKQLIQAYNKFGTTILGGVETQDDETFKRYTYKRYADFDSRKLDQNHSQITEIFENLEEEKVQNKFLILGGSVYTPEIFDALKEALPEIPEGREFYYVDGVQKMIQNGSKVIAHIFDDYRHYDCGNKFEYLKTITEFGLKNEEFGEEYMKFLKGLVRNIKII